MTMRHEFAVRFEPASGARFVQAEAYVRSLSAVLEGLASLRAALAPQLAQKHGWGVPQIRAALTFSVGPTATGSLIVVVLTDAVITEEGSVADVQALEIRPAASAQEADKHFDETFGILRGDWDSAELEAYLGTQTSH